MSFAAYLGKGLREPCAPFRIAPVFGEALNAPDASGWNCLAEIVEPTLAFDLSAIYPSHEVCVALLAASGVAAGTYNIRVVYHKGAAWAKIFDYTYSYTAGAGGWFYAYAYIGFVPWEINEDDIYHASIFVDGPEFFSWVQDFTVTGTRVTEPQPSPVIPSAEGIVGMLNSVSAYFYSLYLTTLGWVWPFYLLANLFYGLSDLFSMLAWSFSDFFTLVNELVSRIDQVLSWDAIQSLILGWFPWLESLGSWFGNWWNNVSSVVTSWWSATQVLVLAWVQSARDFAADLFNQVSSALASLQASWDQFQPRIPVLDQVTAWWGNWTGNVLSAVNAWWTERLLEVQYLISSAFTARESLWAGWQDIRTSVLEFLQDPVEFIWQRFADWFLGPEG